MRCLETISKFLIIIAAAIFVLAAGPALACSENPDASTSISVDNLRAQSDEAHLIKVLAANRLENSVSPYRNGPPLGSDNVRYNTKHTIDKTAILTLPKRDCCSGEGCAACQGCCGSGGMCASSCAAAAGPALLPDSIASITLKRSARACLYSYFKLYGHNVEPGLRPPRV